MNRFYVGQEVVCVAAKFRCIETDLQQDVVKGQVYTVNYMETSMGELYLGFIETNQNAVYRHDGFAPLQTQSEEADMNAALEEIMERELFV